MPPLSARGPDIRCYPFTVAIISESAGEHFPASHAHAVGDTGSLYAGRTGPCSASNRQLSPAQPLAVAATPAFGTGGYPGGLDAGSGDADHARHRPTLAADRAGNGFPVAAHGRHAPLSGRALSGDDELDCLVVRRRHHEQPYALGFPDRLAALFHADAYGQRGQCVAGNRAVCSVAGLECARQFYARPHATRRCCWRHAGAVAPIAGGYVLPVAVGDDEYLSYCSGWPGPASADHGLAACWRLYADQPCRWPQPAAGRARWQPGCARITLAATTAFAGSGYAAANDYALCSAAAIKQPERAIASRADRSAAAPDLQSRPYAL